MSRTRYNISKTLDWQGKLSGRVVELCRMFGLTVDRLAERSQRHSCTLEVGPGDIVYLTGASGAGKSVLLGELQKCLDPEQTLNLGDVELPAERAVIDCVGGDVLSAVRSLCVAGLGGVFEMANSPARLSEGQQWRFRLAVALASGKRFVISDEFCSGLDRITAGGICQRVHKFARRTGTTFILASCRRDILLDLEPDVLVTKPFALPAEVSYKRQGRLGCG